MWDLSPTLVRYENIEKPSVDVSLLGVSQLAESLKGSKTNAGEKLTLPIKNFYMTDVVSRSSVTMAQCSRGQCYALPYLPRPFWLRPRARSVLFLET